MSVDPLVGLTLADRYKILHQIGEGGMGIVYEAQHVVIEKRVALKVLRDDYSKRPEVVERFRQEAKSASRIGHENIVDISDFGETPSGQSYFVMEFLQGEDLANVLEREERVNVQRAAHLIMQCCRALGAAHSKGIVHRDMKPENIFLIRKNGQPDFVKIVDFGIAKMSDASSTEGRKLTKTGMIFGTPEYMSPEQAAGKALDHRVDVYALGVILYEMLTGKVPFTGDNFMGILTQHMFDEPPKVHEAEPLADCPEAVEAIIYRAMAKDADERFQSVEEFGRALANALDMPSAFRTSETAIGYGEPVESYTRGPRLVNAETVDSGEFAGVNGRRGRLWVLATLVLLLGGGAVAGVMFMTGGQGADAGDAGGRSSQEVAAGTAAEAVQRVPTDTATEIDQGSTATKPVLAMVAVQVVTDPSGASVSIEGRGEVCSPTPCAFETKPGEPVSIEVKKGPRSAARSITPTQAMSLEITLKRSRPARPQPTRVSRPTKPERPKGRKSTDLKIPDIFAD